MTSPAVFTQWSTVIPFVGTALPSWVPLADQLRIASYLKYEEIYWTSEEGFSSVLRGDNESPVLVPTAKTLCNTVNRYTAPSMGITVEGADASAVQIAETALAILFKRERFTSQFNGAKARWIRQGDWLWHLLADPAKPAGRRLSLTTVDPGAYFPVYESDVVDGGDPDKVVTVHLAEQTVLGSDQVVSRLTYERVVDPVSGLPTVFRSHGLFKMDKWWSSTTPMRVILPREALPPLITTIPVYHLKNMDDTMPFGSSEMRGLESALLGINQTMSDEDMTLALEGLGVWATDGGAPLDEQGRESDWIMGPGRVLTNANGLKRLNGTTTVTPYGDHYERLLAAVRQAVGASDVAIGRVDAATAESGVALLLQLGPILAYTGEKDQTIKDVHTQMLYDLCYWFAVFDELSPLLTAGPNGPVPSVIITPVFGQKIPANVKEIIDRVVALRGLTPPVISLQTAHGWLRDVGLVVEANEQELIAQEQQGVLNALGATAVAELTDEQRAAQELEAIVP